MRPGPLLTGPPDEYPGSGGYAGPPPTAAHDPGTAPQPWQQYGYPPPYRYGYGYPLPDPADRCPNALTVAAVLGYISAGLLLMAALIVFTGASLVAGIDESDDALNLSRFTIELTFDGVLDLACAAVLIGGGVLMTGRRRGGRTMYSIAATVVAVDAIYWLARWGAGTNAGQGVAAYAVLFCGLSVAGLVLAWRTAATAWFARAAQHPPYAPR